MRLSPLFLYRADAEGLKRHGCVEMNILGRAVTMGLEHVIVLPLNEMRVHAALHAQWPRHCHPESSAAGTPQDSSGTLRP